MPEEKKKESFTFSDKIKSTQASGANKSFANRFTSKIGSDGKPRQTLFERTKRDAPFFIAALVALLLLPFLYKYSGQVEEDTPMVSPGYEDAIINPDRSGFDFSGDADGQISQLSGRDSMDLIVGWGKRHNEEEADASLADFYRSGLSDSSAKSDASSYKRSDMDEETNITNIYKRQRKQAPAQTRAAFRRAATKIGALKGAGLTGRGGGRLGIGHFGGGLKAAAQKVRGPGQVNSTKPVSLQPLQAAGKPSRSYFGQGAAQEARRSKDAMSKGNAMQALMDAQMKPVEPGRIGGLASGDFGGPGGGQGGLQRNFNYNGKEPWWWDMMKTRAQKEWEMWFDIRKSWIMDANKILMSIANCLATGDDGGDVDGFLGSSSAAPECCGLSEEKVKIRFADEWEASGGNLKSFCSAMKKVIAKEDGNPGCGYKGPSAGGGFIATRINCLGGNGAGVQAAWNRLWAKKKGDISTSCETFRNGGNYSAIFSCTDGGVECRNRGRGKASNWETWVYVLGLMPGDVDAYYKATEMSQKEDLLTILYIAKGSTYLRSNDAQLQGIPMFVESAEVYKGKITKYDSKEAPTLENDPILQDLKEKAQAAKAEYQAVLQRSSTNRERSDAAEKLRNAEAAVRNREAQIREMQAKEKQVKEHTIDLANFKGMKYSKFIESLRDGGVLYERSAHAQTPTERRLKGGKEGHDWQTGGRCDFPLVKITCNTAGKTTGVDGANYPVAYINLVGKMAEPTFYASMQDRFLVSYKIQGLDNASSKGVQTDNSNAKERWYAVSTDEYKYGPTPITVKAGHKLTDITGAKGEGNAPYRAVITWEIRQCPDLLSNDGTGITAGGCTSGKVTVRDDKGNVTGSLGQEEPGIVVSTATCYYGDESNGAAPSVDGKIEGCPKGPQTSETCCQQWGQYDAAQTYVWQGGKCVITPKNGGGNGNGNGGGNGGGNGPVTASSHTAFAPAINWVPSSVTGRKPLKAGEQPTSDTFTGKLVNVSPYLFGSGMGIAPESKGTQSCKDQYGLPMDSKLATQFVNRVKDAYNKAHPDLPIVFEAAYPSDGEFIDALHVASEIGITDVPKAAVCELARDFVRMSKDKDVGTWSVRTGMPAAGGEESFHNDLGAFLAYVHDASILYPDAHIVVDNTEYCDYRFQPYNLEDGAKCVNKKGPRIGKAFAHNNYNDSDSDGPYKRFHESRTALMKENPLKALDVKMADTDTSRWFTKCGACKDTRSGRTNYVKKYNSYTDGFAGMLREPVNIKGQGKACEGFVGTGTMSVADALKYVQGVCSAGLDYKPHGYPKNGVRFDPGQKPTYRNRGASGSSPRVDQKEQ